MGRFLRSCGCALRGIGFAAQAQRNFRLQLLAGGLALWAGFRLHLSAHEMALLGLTVALVLVAELVNTSLEYVLNVLEARDHPIVRAAKDIAAGAALLAAVGSLWVGVWVFGPRLMAALGG
jgi:diacylglycerol kinase